MRDSKYEITRRKLLAGVGGVGFASAGAGLGTTAFLNDAESFEGNTVSAGQLDMVVSTDVRDKSPELPDPVVSSTDEGPDDTANGNVVTITVEDMKPGDWFIQEWDIEVHGNPGYVQVTSVESDYSNDEGANPEAETNTATPGDLGGSLLTTIWESHDPTAGSDREALRTLDETTDHNDTWLSGYQSPDPGGETTDGAHYTTLDEVHEEYKDGVVMADASGTPLEVGSGSDYPTVGYYQLFELPPEVGNEIQGDSVTFSIRVDAEQVRHNDVPFDGS